MGTVLVISDTHLGQVFQPAKFALLVRLINQADQVIINGDFWERYLCSWDEFISSPWRQLFPLLRDKKAVYLFGNHDLEELSDYRREKFSTVQAQSYELESGGRLFHLEH